MTFPPVPSYPQSPWGEPPRDPGHIPLRPLSVGDVLAAGFGVVRRHFGLLAPVAVLLAVCSSAASIGALMATGTLREFVTAAWVQDFLDGRQTSLPAGMYLATGLSAVITIAGALILAGLATSAAAADALGDAAGPRAVADRLRGRIGPLLLVAVPVGVATTVGVAALVIPGVLIFLAWVMAVPAAVMEKAGPGSALRRSARLTRGHRGRILGVTVLIMVIAYAIEFVVSSVVLALTDAQSPLATLLVTDAASAVAAAVTTSWVGAVIAVLYIDLRIRKENLATALRAHAARGGQ